MRELALTTIALLGLAALTGFWLQSPTTRAQLLPSNEAPTLTAPTPAPADNPADELAQLEVFSFLTSCHTGLANHEIASLAEAIVAEARRHNLDPALVVGLIRVESTGFNFAVSRVGAYGLMQIMPATGRELAQRLDVPWHGDDTLFDPFVNVKLGTAYLRKLADRYDGDITTALAAYNWGPGAVDRRLRGGKSVPKFYATRVFEAREQMLAQRS
ncbi:MAG: lytic transglycosylase domain-containing protein [Myxococcota bacterium]|nr:lytic transglycosylase domain-containing protein [Myxococcota bacterium]